MTAETSQCPCNTCGGETEHDEISINSFSELDAEGKTVNRFISAVVCRGCKTAAIREKVEKGGANGVQFLYKPPRLWLKRPKWVDDLETKDNTIFGLLVEVYSAANDEQFRLLAMGVRAALDHVMTHILGDIGGFEQKLDEMVTQGHISERQKEMLSIVIDAASAAAHRGYKPPRDLLRQMITVMEAIIQLYYIAGPMLETVRTMIPPRPPRANN